MTAAPPFFKTRMQTAWETMGSQWVEEMTGFRVTWRLYGGFESFQESGMHKSTIWRKVTRFRKMTGEYPDVHLMPGFGIDSMAYRAVGIVKVGRLADPPTGEF